MGETAELVEVEAEPIEAAAEIAEPVEAVAEVVESEAEPVEAVAEVAESEAEPVEAVAEVAESEAEPVEAVAEVEPATADAAGMDESEAEEIAELGDEGIAARLSGLSAQPEIPAQSTTAVLTEVVVAGLVSVASIAAFKRHLGRLPGVTHVGVSSGPEGEFVFNVQHLEDVPLRDLLPTLPGFHARVTGEGPGALIVTARDPES